jgi:hypothetical protein
LPGNTAPRLELQTAMRKRKFNHVSHLRHGPVDRCHPGQCAYREALSARCQPPQQRLRHDGIANPLRGDDQ